MHNPNSRWKSNPVTSRTTSLNNYRKQTKKTEIEVRSLTSRVAYINRHYKQLEKQKLKLINSSKTEKYLPQALTQQPKCVNPTLRNFMKAQEIKRQKQKNNELLKKNKQNTKLSNLVKRYNVNLHKQNKMETILQYQKMKQESACQTRQEKYRKIMRSQREHERLKSQLKLEQNMALERLDSLISEQTKLKEEYKSCFYVTQI